MISTNKSGIVRLIQNCVANGMRHVVCSPGSRNAPIVIALDNHPEIETIVIHDERSAAFFAMGMAQQLKSPVGIVCTSGSAMLNYYPAVAEAYYQCIPLVVISADRPQEWVNHGDGQTIVQKGVYKNHIRYEAEINEFVSENEFELFDKIVHEAFLQGNGKWKGPIHFNCPLTEPLYETSDVDLVSLKGAALEFSELNSSVIEELKSEWNDAQKKMILCGQMGKDPLLLKYLSELANDNSVVVLVENTSNLIHPKFNHCIDRSLSAIPEEELKDFEPDLLITIGGAVISKRIKQFLRGSDVAKHWKIGASFPEMDTYRKLTRSVKCNPSEVFEKLLSQDLIQHISTFGLKWKQLDYLNQDKLPNFIQQAPYSDLTVFEMLLDYLPDNSMLHMGNSSVVRYCQLFEPVASIQYFSNRGTSGIDGSSSTAAGVAFVRRNKMNVLITGDVSFFYDSNALWNNYLGGNFRIVVINNSGGGIFRIIDGPSKTGQLKKYFETDQQFDASKLAEAYGVEYLSASSLVELEAALPQFLVDEELERPKLLEVFTPNEINDSVLRNFFSHFSS
jgi:2-succinyl-5-enolpyruvyl-6-hydroxy-3-cyclohexene-1-carboxylate synthase